MRIAIGIATMGRAPLLSETVRDLSRQSHPADRIIICGASPADYEGLQGLDGVELLISEPGSTKQRNAIIDVASDCDIILFLDDDFLLDVDYLRVFVDAFSNDPTIVSASGRVIADGINGPGFDFKTGMSLLNGKRPPPPVGGAVVDIPYGYGCNMAFRMATLNGNALRFDESLPLYAWYEDIDLMQRTGRHGRVVRLMNAIGVHLGTKRGRTSGRRLGYSQVANPVYLARKGTYPWRSAVESIAKNFTANLVKSIRPEHYVDRRGRLFGNLLGLLDVARRTDRPDKILEL